MNLRLAYCLLLLPLVSCDSKSNGQQSVNQTKEGKVTHPLSPDTGKLKEGMAEQAAVSNAIPDDETKVITSLKGTHFDETLPKSDRLHLLEEFAKSNDPQVIRALVAHIDVPFLEVEKQKMSTVLISRDWEVFPCMQILRKKGEIVIPFIGEELVNPGPSASRWYKVEGEKQSMLLRVLRSVAGLEKAREFLLGMENGPGKTSALRMLDLMSSPGSQ